MVDCQWLMRGDGRFVACGGGGTYFRRGARGNEVRQGASVVRRIDGKAPGPRTGNAVQGSRAILYLPRQGSIARAGTAGARPHDAHLASGACQEDQCKTFWPWRGRWGEATEAVVVVAVVWIVPVAVGGAHVVIVVVPRAATQNAHRRPHINRQILFMPREGIGSNRREGCRFR